MILLAEIVTMADVFKIVFIILAFFLTFLASWLLAAGLLPGITERCAEHFTLRPVKATLIGAVTFGPLFAVGAVVANLANPALKLIGVGILMLSILVALFGSAGLATRIGIGLHSSLDEREPWRRVRRGGVVLGLSFISPIIGTFLIMPWALVSGFGAFLLAMRKSETPVALAAALPVT